MRTSVDLTVTHETGVTKARTVDAIVLLGRGCTAYVHVEDADDAFRVADAFRTLGTRMRDAAKLPEPEIPETPVDEARPAVVEAV